MPKTLRDIRLSEISFVDKGASGDDELAARVAIWKRKEPMSFLDRLKAGFKKADEVPTAEQVKEALLGSLNEEQAAMFASFLELYAAEMAPKAVEEPEAEPVEMADGEKENVEMADDEEMKKALEANPAIAEEIKKLRSDREEMKKLLDNEIAKRRAENFKKAADDMTFIPEDHDKVAKLMDEADLKLSEEAQATLAKVFTASQAAVKGSPLLKSRGSADAPETDERQIVDSAVKKIRDENPGMSAPVALTKALKDPDVKRAYVNTRMGNGE